MINLVHIDVRVHSYWVALHVTHPPPPDNTSLVNFIPHIKWQVMDLLILHLSRNVYIHSFPPHNFLLSSCRPNHFT